MNTTRFPQLFGATHDAVDELETMFPGRHFTPDGHLVGSLGEALAAHHYQLELLPASARCHDGLCDGRSVQIKATQGNRIAISSQPDFLLVLKLNRDGGFIEAYNGPGEADWSLVSHNLQPKNGHYQVSLSKLRCAAGNIHESLQIPRRAA